MSSTGPRTARLRRFKATGITLARRTARTSVSPRTAALQSTHRAAARPTLTGLSVGTAGTEGGRGVCVRYQSFVRPSLRVLSQCRRSDSRDATHHSPQRSLGCAVRRISKGNVLRLRLQPSGRSEADSAVPTPSSGSCRLSFERFISHNTLRGVR